MVKHRRAGCRRGSLSDARRGEGPGSQAGAGFLLGLVFSFHSCLCCRGVGCGESPSFLPRFGTLHHGGLWFWGLGQRARVELSGLGPRWYTWLPRETRPQQPACRDAFYLASFFLESLVIHWMVGENVLDSWDEM